MKKMRRGFTLVELLIVISVIGILGAMGTMGGSEATSIATATKIVEDFNIIGSAMNMYYADNRNATFDAAGIKTGITPYLKSVTSIVTDEAAENKFLIAISGTDSSWWLTYTIPAGDVTKVGGILKNKAAQQGLVTAVDSTTDYAGAAAVSMKVR